MLGYALAKVSCVLLQNFQNDRPPPRRPTTTAQMRSPLRKEREQSLLVLLSGHKAFILTWTMIAMSSKRMIAVMSSTVIKVREMDPILFFRFEVLMHRHISKNIHRTENLMGRTFFLIELFSGSSSVARAAKATLPSNWNFKVHSVDIHPHYNPTTTTDILKWDYQPAIQQFLASARPNDVIWVHASPPCTEFSKAKTTAPRDLPLADSLVKRTLRIIKYAKKLAENRQPFYWSLENPVGLLRSRPYMQRLLPYRNTTSYCKWGKPFRKDTDIWTNVPDLDMPLCRKGTYCPEKEARGHHSTTAQSGPSSSGSREVAGSGAGENVYPLPKRLTSFIIRSALQNQ